MLMFEIEATNHCNIRCLHCPHESIQRPTGRMSWETYEQVIRRIREYTQGEKFSISYSGMGEPLLNPLIYRFIRHVSDDAVTAFSSNGSTLSEGNIAKLLEAGLDTIYISFNADEPELFTKMTGGLKLEQILANLQRSMRQVEGTRLRLQANISITKANAHRVPHTKKLLEDLGIRPVTTSLVHNRGGFLDDNEVCDTPVPTDLARWDCDVLRQTLFIDWRGKVLICAHDLAGQHVLGDLLVEPLADILRTREKMLAHGVSPELCKTCNDVLRIGQQFPLRSKAGGLIRDWNYYLYENAKRPRAADAVPAGASESMRWVHRIFAKQDRLDLLFERLLELEDAGHVQHTQEREALHLERRQLIEERDRYIHERNRLEHDRNRYRDIAADLDRERVRLLEDQAVRAADRGQLVARIEALQGTLNERDAQFSALHAEYAAMRSNRVWRFANMLLNDFRRLRGLLGAKPRG